MNKPKPRRGKAAAETKAAGATGKSIALILPAGIRLDKFLSGAMEGEGEELSRSRLQKLIDAGAVEGIDPKKIKASYKAKQDTAIQLLLPGEKETILKPLDIDLPILFEDRNIAVVHKPAGMTVHPGAGTGDDTLVHALLSNIDTLAPDAERPGIVHRLDRETEGVMIIAKTEKARTALSRDFAERKIRKSYAALIWGKVTLPDDISGFIWRDVHDRKKMRFGIEVPARITRAREAELVIKTQTQLKYATRLEIDLITGRTHQIRATVAFFNAPIIGDTVYGDDVLRAKLYKIGKEKKKPLADCGMLLVAQTISLKHPFSAKRLTLSIPLPERFLAIEKLLS